MQGYTVRLEEDWLDYPSIEDHAIAVIFTGCSHHCLDCHSQHLQAFIPYAETKEEILDKIVDFARRSETNKLVFLGGDPLHDHTLPITKYICEKIGNTHDICIFTGYNIEYVKTLNISGPKYYKCGTFDKNTYQKPEKTDKNYILASRNQNFYDSMYKQLSKDGILTFNN